MAALSKFLAGFIPRVKVMASAFDPAKIKNMQGLSEARCVCVCTCVGECVRGVVISCCFADCTLAHCLTCEL